MFCFQDFISIHASVYMLFDTINLTHLMITKSMQLSMRKVFCDTTKPEQGRKRSTKQPTEASKISLHKLNCNIILIEDRPRLQQYRQ